MSTGLAVIISPVGSSKNQPQPSHWFTWRAVSSGSPRNCRPSSFRASSVAGLTPRGGVMIGLRPWISLKNPAATAVIDLDRGSQRGRNRDPVPRAGSPSVGRPAGCARCGQFQG